MVEIKICDGFKTKCQCCRATNVSSPSPLPPSLYLTVSVQRVLYLSTVHRNLSLRSPLLPGPDPIESGYPPPPMWRKKMVLLSFLRRPHLRFRLLTPFLLPPMTLLSISAGVIAVILYKFTTTIESGLNRQTISDNLSDYHQRYMLSCNICFRYQRGRMNEDSDEDMKATTEPGDSSGNNSQVNENNEDQSSGD